MFDIENGLFKFDLTDYHAILGISLKAEGKDIRKRYLKIAQALHPDTCKAVSEADKRAANQLLSKLVNPAYENLSKDQNRREHQIILSQIGKRLAADNNQITIGSDSARELFQAQGNVESVYQNLLNAIAANQYASLKDVLMKIAQLSELNLVYLILTQGQNITNNSQASSKVTTPPSTDSSFSNSETIAPVSVPKNPYLRRGQEYIDKNNYAKAVLELREGLKSNPNNAEIHSLLGYCYIQEKQFAMGRVHIKKALQLEPRNTIAKECQDILDKISPENNNKNKENSKKTGGGLFGLFGGKK
jgi:curved DNA-binding protein CbpA